MTCQECELALAGEDRGGEVEGHLSGCTACGEFARELSANGDALRLMAVDPMPSVALPGSRKWPWVAAAVAIAAMIVLMLAMPKERTPLRSRLNERSRGNEVPAVSSAAVPPLIVHKSRRAHKRNVQPEILQVKMLTADPNVVIYWQIENKKGSE